MKVPYTHHHILYTACHSLLLLLLLLLPVAILAILLLAGGAWCVCVVRFAADFLPSCALLLAFWRCQRKNGKCERRMIGLQVLALFSLVLHFVATCAFARSSGSKRFSLCMHKQTSTPENNPR